MDALFGTQHLGICDVVDTALGYAGQKQLQLPGVDSPSYTQEGKLIYSCKHSFVMFKDVGMAFFPKSKGISLCGTFKKRGNTWCVFNWLCQGRVEDAKKHCPSTF